MGIVTGRTSPQSHRPQNGYAERVDRYRSEGSAVTTVVWARGHLRHVLPVVNEISQRDKDAFILEKDTTVRAPFNGRDHSLTPGWAGCTTIFGF